MERKVQVIMDASADLSPEVAEARRIAVLPIRLRIDDRLYLDDGSQAFNRDFYQKLWRHGESFAQVEAADEDDIAIWLEKNTVYSPYRLQILTGNATRTQLFEKVQHTISDNLQVFKRLRLERGIFEHFNIKVLGSRLMFGGQSVLAHEASRMADKGAALADISFYLQAAAKRVTTLVAPGAMGYLKARGVDGGYGWIDAKGLNIKIRTPVVSYRGGVPGIVAKEKSREAAETFLLGTARAMIEGGEVDTPVLIISQAEEAPALRQQPGFTALAAAAAKRDIELIITPMSAASAIAAGPGAIAASWIAAD